MSRGGGKKRKIAEIEDLPADLIAIAAEQKKVAGLVGRINTKDELAAFNHYVTINSTSSKGDICRKAYQAHIKSFGEDFDEQSLWVSNSIYGMTGEHPSYFFPKTPLSLNLLQDFASFAELWSAVANEGRLEELSTHQEFRKAMGIKGRSRCAQMIKAYMFANMAPHSERLEHIVWLRRKIYQRIYGNDILPQEQTSQTSQPSRRKSPVARPSGSATSKDSNGGQSRIQTFDEVTNHLGLVSRSKPARADECRPQRRIPQVKENEVVLQAEISKLAALAGSIQSEEEVAAFSEYYNAIDNSPGCKIQRDAVCDYLEQFGDPEYEASIWQSVNMYRLMGKSSAYFLKSTPARSHTLEYSEEILGVAVIMGSLALQGRLEILAEHDAIKRAMEARGRSRGAEILRAYMEVYKQSTGLKEWNYDAIGVFHCHVHQKAYHGIDWRETESLTGSSLDRPSPVVNVSPRAVGTPRVERSHSPAGAKEEESQQDEDIYNDDDSTRAAEHGRGQEDSRMMDRARPSPSPEQETESPAVILHRCQTTVVSTTIVSNKARKQYPSLDEKLIRAFTKLLTEDTATNGTAATIASVEAKAEACKIFGKDKADRIRSQFKEPLEMEHVAKVAVQIAEHNQATWLELQTTQETDSDDWEI